jgi:hypothetical protein
VNDQIGRDAHIIGMNDQFAAPRQADQYPVVSDVTSSQD